SPLATSPPSRGEIGCELGGAFARHLPPTKCGQRFREKRNQALLSSPTRGGESHLMRWGVLRVENIWILRVSPFHGGTDAWFHFDLRSCRRPAGRERAAQPSGTAVHRAGCRSVWRGELLGHGRLRRGQGRDAAGGAAPGTRHPEPRHLQSGV